MAVSPEYLAKIRFAVRRNENTLMDSELTDVIEQGKAELIRMGVSETVATDETNALVLGCIGHLHVGRPGAAVTSRKRAGRISA